MILRSTNHRYIKITFIDPISNSEIEKVEYIKARKYQSKINHRYF